MFSYYGSKSKIAHLYPAPAHDIIVEPFAGSARYSLLHWEHDVRLYDTSDYVYETWHYLQAASTKDILGLPDVPSKLSLNTVRGLSIPERYLIGWHLCRGKAKPRHTGHGQNSWAQDKVRIANDLHKIKHWHIFRYPYNEAIVLGEATYFVDPPYEQVQIRPGNSDRYPEWFVDYDRLAEWCKTRHGQVIVCEGEGATWLPFRELTTTGANTNAKTVKQTKELIWTN